jgi:hypothetical protein
MSQFHRLSDSPTASARGKWLGGVYGDNDVVNSLASCGGLRLVFQELRVGGVNVTVQDIGRQGPGASAARQSCTGSPLTWWSA